MKTLDCSGQACPFPVVNAKKAIAELPETGGVVHVLVDNETATENLTKMAQNNGHAVEVTKTAENAYSVLITVGQQTEEKPAAEAGLVVAIGSNVMGNGDDVLGKILIKGFIYSISQLDVAPQSVVFFNAGVLLTLNDANTVDDLKVLAARGTTILVCGTCLDFYNRKDDLAVGEVSNMYGIVEAMNDASRIISI